MSDLRPRDASENEAEAGLPPVLQSALAGAFGKVPVVPAAVDQAILREGREGFNRRRRFRIAVRWAGATAAAAAAAAVAIAVVNLRSGPSATWTVATVQQSVGAGDADRNGRVDI